MSVLSDVAKAIINAASMTPVDPQPDIPSDSSSGLEAPAAERLTPEVGTADVESLEVPGETDAIAPEPARAEPETGERVQAEISAVEISTTEISTAEIAPQIAPEIAQGEIAQAEMVKAIARPAERDYAVGEDAAIAQGGGTALAVKELPAPDHPVETSFATPEKDPEKNTLGQRLQQKFQTAAQATSQTTLRRLKQRPTQLLLLGAVTTFVLGGATSYLLRRPGNGPSSLEPALALVPDSAVASLSLNPEGEPWQALRQLGTPNLQQGLGEWLAVGRDRIVNLGYGDLSGIQQQLAGPPVMALIPMTPATQPPAGQPPQAGASDLLLVAPLKNPKALARSLAERQPPEGFSNSSSSHRGIKIWDLQVDLSQRQSVAIFGSFGLLASNRSTLERAIDSYKEGTALGDLNEYEDAQRRLGDNDLNSADGALLSFYINGPAAVLSNQAAGRLLPLPAALQGLVGQVWLAEGDELDLRTVTWDQTADGLGVLAPAAPDLGDQPKAMVALGDRFPASTSFLLSGSSLQEAWRSFSQGPDSGNSLFSPSALQQQVQAVTSMDLQQDWLSWMDGPYSVGILPIPSQANSRFQTGLTVMAQTSNRRLAERSLQKLDALMVNKYGLRLSTSELDGQPVVNWSNANGEAVVTHGWLEGNVAFLIVGAPGANLLLPQPRATLAASRLYREGMPRVTSQDPAGVMFVDVDRVLDTQLPSLLPLTPASRPVLDQLRSIGVERRPLDERFSQYDLSLKFLPRSAAPPVEAPALPNGSAPESSSPEAPPAETASPEARTTAEPAETTNAIPQLGPALPGTQPTFGPALQATLEPGDSATDPSASFPSLPPSDLPGNLSAEPLGNTPGNEATGNAPATLEDTAADSPPAPASRPEDIVIDPRTAIPVGPPTPSRDFDFTPLGPKFPPPEAQQWSGNFIQSPTE